MIDANKSALNFAGISSEHIFNKPFWETPWWTHSETEQQKLKDNIRTAASGQQVRFESTHCDKDGNLRYIDVSIKPIFDDDNRVTHLIPEGHDVTERKNAEDELRTSEARLNAILCSMNDIIFELDLNGNFESFRAPESEKLLLPPDEFIGKNVTELFPESINKLVLTAISNILEGDKFQEYEYELTKNNQIAWENTVITPRYTANKELVGVTAVCRNITNKKRTELALLESEQRYKLLVNTIMYPLIVTTQDGRVLFANQKTSDFFDIPFREITKQKNYDYWVSNEKREEFIRELNECGFVHNKEVLFKTKHGIFTVILSSSILEMYGETVVLSIFNDITKQKALEHQILTISIDTEEKERLHFAQELHDGLSPLLSAAKMYLQWVQQTENPDEIPEYLEKALVLIDDSYRTAREISHMMRPHVLQTQGLFFALKNITEKIQGTKIDKIELIYANDDVTQQLNQLNIQKQTIIYRVLLECINNTLKHAEASEIKIIFSKNELEHTIDINYFDNGTGFDVNNIMSQTKGIGLLNLKNRMHIAGGSFAILSEPNKGVHIKLRLKFEPSVYHGL